MNYSIEMNEIIEERYRLCIWLYRIKKNTDRKNKEKSEQGEKNLVYVDIFAKPCHIKKLFGCFLKTPQYTDIATLGHTGRVYCLASHKNKLYSGGIFQRGINVKGTIIVWDTDTHEKIADLRGHTSGVYCMSLYDNKLFSGGGDRTIRVWNTDTYEEIAILEGHEDTIDCIALYDKILYSGGNDKTIRIWNTESYEQIAVLRGHNGRVVCLTFHDNKLYSGCNGNIHIRNIDTHEIIFTLNSITLKEFTGGWDARHLIINDNKLYSVHFNTICVWNIETYENIAILEKHNCWIKCLDLNENKLYSGGGYEDFNIHIWNTDTDEQIASMKENTYEVVCLTVHKNKMYYGRSNTIRVWKV